MSEVDREILIKQEPTLLQVETDDDISRDLLNSRLLAFWSIGIWAERNLSKEDVDFSQFSKEWSTIVDIKDVIQTVKNVSILNNPHLYLPSQISLAEAGIPKGQHNTHALSILTRKCSEKIQQLAIELTGADLKDTSIKKVQLPATEATDWLKNAEGVWHDFIQNPGAVALRLSYMKRLSPDKHGEVKDKVRRIFKQISRDYLILTEDLSENYSRQRLSPDDLNDQMNYCSDTFSQEGDIRINIFNSIDKGTGFVYSNHLLQNILLNTTRNSFNALPRENFVKKGAITFHASEVTEGDSKMVRITVEDNGHGFPKDVIENGLGNAHSKWGGEGIGLARHQKILRNFFNGDLRISNLENNSGEVIGAQVLIELPVTE